MLYQKFKNNIDNLIGYPSNDELIFPSTIALAISGGSDSIALLMLTHKWASTARQEIKLVVLSMDHQLRPESKQESQYVQALANKLGHSYYQLHFDHNNNFSNLQARAREARYKLMTELCLKLDILTILSAHHYDDYLENYCLRLEKNSSIFGLSASYIMWYNNVKIARPLFNIRKQQLVEYLLSNNIQWLEDESNLSDKYRRNVIRKKLNTGGECKKNQVMQEQLAINQQVAEKLQPEFIACIAQSIQTYDFGFSTINLLKFLEFSHEIKLQTLSFVLIIISGKNYTGRIHSIMRIYELLLQPASFTKTLHGCIIKKIDNNVIIYPEIGRNTMQEILLNNGCIWDNRFLFHVDGSMAKLESQNYFIGNLTMKNYSEIRETLALDNLKNLSFNNHLAILFTLPVIKILEKVIAMPHLSYYDNESLKKEFSVYFYPNFISRFTHFCYGSIDE